MIDLSDRRVKASVTLEALYLLMISCDILLGSEGLKTLVGEP